MACLAVSAPLAPCSPTGQFAHPAWRKLSATRAPHPQRIGQIPPKWRGIKAPSGCGVGEHCTGVSERAGSWEGDRPAAQHLAARGGVGPGFLTISYRQVAAPQNGVGPGIKEERRGGTICAPRTSSDTLADSPTASLPPVTVQSASGTPRVSGACALCLLSRVRLGRRPARVVG